METVYKNIEQVREELGVIEVEYLEVEPQEMLMPAAAKDYLEQLLASGGEQSRVDSLQREITNLELVVEE